MKKHFLSMLTLASCTLLLSACGQKGPLYLPEKETPPVLQKGQPNDTTTKENKLEQQQASESTHNGEAL